MNNHEQSVFATRASVRVRPRNQAMPPNAVEAAVAELEASVALAIETYSNVHRGSGHHSQVSTHLYEQARAIVLEHLGLSADTHVVIFATPRSADALVARLEPASIRSLSSRDVGLPLGVRALAVERRALPKGPPVLTGGGTARLVGPDWVMWARTPDRFEAGTPAISIFGKTWAPHVTEVLRFEFHYQG